MNPDLNFELTPNSSYERIFGVIETVMLMSEPEIQVKWNEINKCQPFILHLIIELSKRSDENNHPFLNTILLQIWEFYRIYPKLVQTKIDRTIFNQILQSNHEKTVEIELKIKNLEPGQNIEIGRDGIKNLMFFNVIVFNFSNQSSLRLLPVTMQAEILITIQSIIQTLDLMISDSPEK